MDDLANKSSQAMLIIRAEHLSALTQATVTRFDDSLVDHLGHFAPLQAQVLGPDGLRRVVRSGRERAAQIGFTNREPIRLYVELMLLFGSGFATDPQYPWAAEALAPDGEPQDQQLRAGMLHVNALQYTHSVFGVQRELVFAALERLAEHQLRDFLNGGPFPEVLIRRLYLIFPEKCLNLGEDRIRMLIHLARRTAEQHSLSADAAVALLTILMFLLGHEVDRDPTSPWVETTLRETALAEPPARVRVLESRTWAELNTVLVINPGIRAHGLARFT